MPDRKHEFIINVNRETRDKVMAAARKRSDQNGERISENISDIFNEAVGETLRGEGE